MTVFFASCVLLCALVAAGPQLRIVQPAKDAQNSCAPLENLNDVQLQDLANWNCHRVIQASNDFEHLARHYGRRVTESWEKRTTAAAELCDQAKTAPSASLAAQLALEAWGDTMMLGRECCNINGPPFCRSTNTSQLARLAVLVVTLLAVCLTSASVFFCKDSVHRPNLYCTASPSRAAALGPTQGRSLLQPDENSGLAEYLKSYWDQSTLRNLPEAEAYFSQVARCFEHLMIEFDFQMGNVENQFEHFVSLWRSHMSVYADRELRKATHPDPQSVEKHIFQLALRELHADLLRSFKQWQQKFYKTQHGPPNYLAPWRSKLREQHQVRGTGALAGFGKMDCEHLEEVVMFLLVWGEAGNLRFMPELLYFLTELALQANAQPLVETAASRRFLVAVVRPIYAVIFNEHYDGVNQKDKKQLRKGYENFLPADAANYDDWNELFCKTEWLTEALVISDANGGGKLFDKFEAGKRFEALPLVDWAASLDVKMHREQHSWWGIFAATHRVWFLHLLLYFVSIFWVASRDFRDNGRRWDVLLGGDSPPVCLAAVGLLVPAHALAWKLSRWFVTGKSLRCHKYRNASGCATYMRGAGQVLVDVAIWGLPLVTFFMVRYLDAFGDDQFTAIHPVLSVDSALWLHFLLSIFLGFTILQASAQRGDELWPRTPTGWRTRAVRWLFWVVVLAAKVVVGLRGVAAMDSAAKQLQISRPGRESLVELPMIAFGPNWDKDMIEWMVLWGTGFICYAADTQLWFVLGCSVLAVLLALKQRSWRLLGLATEDTVANIPQRFSERVLLQDGKPWRRTPPNRASESIWFPDMWNRVIEYMQYEDKLEVTAAAQLRYTGQVFVGEASADGARMNITWTELQRKIKATHRCNPPMIFKPTGSCARFFRRDIELLPDENWPENTEVRWRINAFGRCLASADLPLPFHTPYIPGLTVMIPHATDTIMLSKTELYDANTSDRREVVPLMSWLHKRYRADFQALSARGFGDYHPGNHWDQYTDAQWEKLQSWSSMRSQTLWRTVVGMMLYRPALECYYEADIARRRSAQETKPLLEWKSEDGSLCEVFTCLVAMQLYQDFNAEQLKYTEKMLTKYENDDRRILQIAYISNEAVHPSQKSADAIHPNQQRRYFSCLIDSTCKKDKGTNRRTPRLQIELPGFPILGDGKGDNQNHALPFSRGSIVQTIDANQGAYFEQMLLLPCILGEFRKDGPGLQPRIVGFPEHITSDIGSLGDFAAGAETAFGTVLQRSYSAQGARMHYGHPDMMNKEFMMQQGGVSKATKTVNLSEDIFAGMDFTLRGDGRSIVHREYFYVGKGRDLGFNTILKFFSKLSAGTGEQVLTRQMFRLGELLDLPELLSFYYAHAGFYLTNFLLSKSIPLLVFLWLLVVLDDPEFHFSDFNQGFSRPESGAEVMAQLLVLQYGWLVALYMLAQALPLLFQVWLESGIVVAVIRIVKQVFTLAPLHFIFQAKVIGAYITSEIIHGGATYLPTGRGLPTERKPFIGPAKAGAQSGLYNDYAELAFYDGAELLAGFLIVVLAGGLNIELKWSLVWWLLSLSLTICAWLFAPFVFNPYQFSHKHFRQDLKDLRDFFLNRVGPNWQSWYEASLLRADRGVRASPVGALLCALFLACWYTVLNQKAHLLSILFPDDIGVAWTTARVMLPPVGMSLLACGLCSCRGRSTHLAHLAPAVVVLDCVEAVLYLWNMIEIGWWKTFFVGVVLKYALLSTVLSCCEAGFCCQQATCCTNRDCWTKNWLRLWLYSHRLARDVVVSSLIFWPLAVGAFFDWCRSRMCPGLSLHHLVVYRDPGGLQVAEEQTLSRQAGAYSRNSYADGSRIGMAQ